MWPRRLRPPAEAMGRGLQIRIHGVAGQPTLVYLPGLHGDWHMTQGIRDALGGRVRWVEFTYPGDGNVSLEDQVMAIADQLEGAGIRDGWILGESFGSQIAWRLLRRSVEQGNFTVRGLFLVGGFVRYPWRLGVRLARPIVRHLPGWILGITLRTYLLRIRGMGRCSPQVRRSLEDFIERRLEPSDRAALLHRLDLILGSDPRDIARATRVPVWSLMGFWDPIVPWIPVRRWLRRECPGWRGDRVIWGADHAPLVSAPERSAEVILGWMEEGRGHRAGSTEGLRR